ncbi:hypothetical protein OAR97_02320 [Arcobacteraceae bacterium]|nr:hypothetical protein [Arcobacteraceae bacterium]
MYNFTSFIDVLSQNKGLVIKNKLKDLKQRIEDNYNQLDQGYKDNSHLEHQVLQIINLLLSANTTDDKIKIYLGNISNALEIVEEKLSRIENKK